MLFLRKSLRAGRVVWAFAVSLGELLVRRPQTRPARAAWLTGLCRRVLRAANIAWTANGTIPVQGAVISNHLTYVDIMIHAALRPCVFVSAIETRRLPLLGWMSMMAGTVYVVRGAGGSAAKAASGMAEGFQDGLPVVFFPEGGTGVGDVPLLPLHSGLLAAAIQAGAPVTPGYVRYKLGTQDLTAGKTTRDDVHWGKQTLPAHLWNLFGLEGLQGSITFAPAPIPFSPAALADRKIAAVETRAALLALAQNET